MKIKHPQGEEFEARQMCLDFFGHAARVVLPIIVQLRKDLRAWEKPARIVRAKLSSWILPLFGDAAALLVQTPCHQ
ncbi:hypothetical protein [Aromatoleum evansii]|uniref:hypothetical protein n=1 Tax=Aromatoleum evansii TaxID=59406 RepID=UPI00145E57B2|nr:hypothetical protein [Aromatoleum evansii]NMG32607.1 hypothetical protein [Aromatoleum evansii]